MQIRGSQAGGALRLSLPCKPSVVIPGSPSARLTRGLKLNTGQWLLRFSVLRGSHVTFACGHFKKLKCCHFFNRPLEKGDRGNHKTEGGMNHG